MSAEESRRTRRQLLVLTATYVRIVLRHVGGTWLLLLLIGGGAVLGAALAVTVSLIGDLAGTSLLVVTLAMVVTMGSVWSGASSLVSPPDARFINAQPVTSRTYFVARAVSAVLGAWFWISVALWPVFVTVASDYGFGIGAALALAAYCSAATAMLYVQAGQLYLLLRLRGQPLSIVIGALLVALVIGTLLLLGVTVDPSGSIRAATTVSWPSVASPATWFAVWPSLVAGDLTLVGLVSASLGIAALVVAGLTLASGASDRYLERVIELQAEHREVGDGGCLVPVWNEWYVTTQLVVAALRRDSTVTVAVLMPAFVFLSSMTVGWGSPRLQEFSGPVPIGPHPLWYLTFGFICIPLVARWSLVASDAHHAAAWVFRAAPVDRSRLLLAFNSSVVIISAIPAALFAGGVLWYADASGTRILLHLVTCTLLAFILVQFYSIFDLSPPLSRPARGREAIRRGFLFCASLVGAFPLASLVEVVHRSPRLRLPLLCVAAIASVGIASYRARLAASDGSD